MVKTVNPAILLDPDADPIDHKTRHHCSYCHHGRTPWLCIGCHEYACCENHNKPNDGKDDDGKDGDDDDDDQYDDEYIVIDLDGPEKKQVVCKISCNLLLHLEALQRLRESKDKDNS